MKSEDLQLLQALAAASSEWQLGLQLGREAGLAAGLAYPQLARLERLGAVESRWEDAGAKGAPRRLYRITGVGQVVAREAAGPSPERRRPWFPGFGVPEGQPA